MDTQNKTVECTVSVTINDEIKNIRIRPNEQMWDARIRVNDKTVEVKSKKIPNGGALFFEQNGATANQHGANNPCNQEQQQNDNRGYNKQADCVYRTCKR